MSTIKYCMLGNNIVTRLFPKRTYSWCVQLRHQQLYCAENWLKVPTSYKCHKRSHHVNQSSYQHISQYGLQRHRTTTVSWQTSIPLQHRGFSLSTYQQTIRDEDDTPGHESLGREEDGYIDDSEIDELFQHQVPMVGEGDHRVFIVHPDVKWGSRKQYLTTANLMMAEAVGLVNTLQNWSVIDKIILSTKTPEKKMIFGKGNFQTLTERIRRTPGVTAVFVNVERLSPASEKEFEEAWGVKVFDRYSVVLHIFRCNARTKEAKLQVSLAEIPLLRSRLRNEVANLDQQGGGSRYIMGSGKPTVIWVQVSYSNMGSGKTTLIKALTGDAALQPRDQLFATLDVTVHAGTLPSHMTVLYVDTIGFLSQLPHQLIDSFSATLEDVIHSDLIVHVRDISHPETVNQKENVLNVLRNLQIPDRLMSSIVEVHNKIDLVDSYEPSEPNSLPISALREQGLEELKIVVEEAIVRSTGKQVLTLPVDLSSSQLSWLYKEATVQEVDVNPDEGSAVVKVIISAAAYGRYRKTFQLS
ncbi:putative GTP-binding protein 6 [Salvelinus sp. IW2-2015]|uniref:putative GTP-binding protein 6 n=1 Tax=Salvelinus sp. IW2-2015 TaxID=2691554 RepID=UPI0038D45CA8